MAEGNVAFVGSVPENYDRYLGPLLFEPYAKDLAGRVPKQEGISVLEVACGTGIVTQHLRAALPPGARLVATDLNEGMLAFAQRKLGPQADVHWQTADAMCLPFDGKMFDTVVCQFGLMFVPDKQSAIQEAHRVLRPGGSFLFNVWDSLAENHMSQVAHETIVSFFRRDPVRFFETPFGCYDPAAIRSWLETAGFSNIRMTAVRFTGVSPSAMDAARGLVQGTPVVVAVKNRDVTQIRPLTEAVAAALAREFGEAPCRDRMQALVWEATR